jgi:hypothetical protein
MEGFCEHNETLFSITEENLIKFIRFIKTLQCIFSIGFLLFYLITCPMVLISCVFSCSSSEVCPLAGQQCFEQTCQ